MKRTFLLVLFVSSTLWAMGRRSDYEERTIYDPNKVQRGSPANPNSAFAPPRFEDTPMVESAKPAPSDDDRNKARATQKRSRTQNADSVSDQAPPPVNVVPAPAPKAKEMQQPKPLTVNSSEPPLPEEHIEGLDISPSSPSTH